MSVNRPSTVVWLSTSWIRSSRFPSGIALHARALTFQHPALGTPLTLIAPWPGAWEEAGILLEAADNVGRDSSSGEQHHVRVLAEVSGDPKHKVLGWMYLLVLQFRQVAIGHAQLRP